MQECGCGMIQSSDIKETKHQTQFSWSEKWEMKRNTSKSSIELEESFKFENEKQDTLTHRDFGFS